MLKLLKHASRSILNLVKKSNPLSCITYGLSFEAPHCLLSGEVSRFINRGEWLLVSRVCMQAYATKYRAQNRACIFAAANSIILYSVSAERFSY